MKKILFPSLLLLLALVGGGMYLAKFRPQVTAVPVAELDAEAQKNGLADCFWVGASSGGTLLSYPDTGANYWLTQFKLPQGAELTLDGEFPHARHLSFNSYDQQARPVDRLNDVMIQPKPGGINPFVPGATRQASQRAYQLRLIRADQIEAGSNIAAVDARRPANTLYLPADDKPQLLWMRIYVPDQGRGAKGGVALPKPRMRLADGKVLEGEALCREMVIKEGAVRRTAMEADANQTLLTLRSQTSAFHPAQKELRWYAFFNPSYAVLPYLAGTRFESIKDLISARRQGGFFSTLDNTYMAAMVDRRFGDVLVLQGRAPRVPATQSGPDRMPTGDLRYWSFCKYRSLYDNAVDSCLFDEQVPVDAQGRYTLVISTPQARPRNANKPCGVAWMDWGSQGDGLGNPAGGILVYRQMLPAPDFKQSLFEVHQPGDEQAALGPFFPAARYLSVQEFESTGCSTTG
ncbi:hypothetical protein DBR47_17140 [Paucibacter sp. KBW04]|uniref:hypothetical protein n=1 Tax=Paucibacter sp. KBW04 TaxID=2153361 RepID=UPI000F55A1A2|nr:hypothetical protein [Paucibacter sp. KBW04]RQO56268.1 hypothetical protein DBR47_17140 [Paucibacter sp. KBW04]